MSPLTVKLILRSRESANLLLQLEEAAATLSIFILYD